MLTSSLVHRGKACENAAIVRPVAYRRSAATVGLVLLVISSVSLAEDVPSDAFRNARSRQVSAGVGILLPTEVRAHLRTGTEPSASFHIDATLPGPLFEYGVYLREVRLKSSETGGTASLFTIGVQTKYELRLRRWCVLRAGLLVGFHELVTDTINNAMGLDLGAALEWAARSCRTCAFALPSRAPRCSSAGFPANKWLPGLAPLLPLLLERSMFSSVD